ncbi:hypothetical protein [Streptomyces sp. NPDC053560]|uniref:hypothetical protein n=1 Tax=Streptomyces sp. NPDC053560 TaxID=3365711 RepID=UPI0037CD6D40
MTIGYLHSDRNPPLPMRLPAPVFVSGALDFSAASELRERLIGRANESDTFVYVDLSGVTRCTAQLLCVLIAPHGDSRCRCT